jgi:hypothetical protein
MSICFLVSFLACVFFLAVGPIYEVVIQSCILFSLYRKIQKHFHMLHYGIFSFDYFTLILTHVERLHFIEILEIALKSCI